MFKRSFLFLLFLCVVTFSAHATHNRAGEITYKRIEPFKKVVGGVEVPVFTYSITVIKYTDDDGGSQPLIADRCVDTIDFGDNERGVALRINGSTGCGCGSIGGVTVGCGVIIINDNGYRVKKNIYTIIHTYPGSGNYIIRSFDPNRNADVHNIPGSVNLPFYIESMLVINNFTGANSSPIFTFPPVDKACMGICFEHNPGAYDPDGDSLSFELTTSRGLNGQTVVGYFFPETGGGTYNINPTTGELRWCTPQLQKEYNIAFIVREWRKSTSGNYQMIGYVLRDMQVIVNACPTAFAPEIAPITDVCVEAGKQVDKELTISDRTKDDIVTISGGGGPFSGVAPLATINPTSGVTSVSNNNSFKVNFKWTTSCDHIRQQAYNTTFKAEDKGTQGVKLTNFQSFNIKVVPPTVKNVTATPIGTTMKITWTPSTCSPATNKLVSYLIYRKNDCETFIPDPCQTGVAEASGFVLVGTVAATQSSFLDDNAGDGLVVGQNYSYIVVARYQDGSQSFGSSQVCTELKRDVPVIINVDVLSTANNGSISVKWLKPLTTPGNLDLKQFPGPYILHLKHKAAPTDSYAAVFTTTQTVFNNLEESFIHSNINTTGPSHEYMLEFFSGTVSVGSSQKATSISLTTTPSDRQIQLQWSSKTPWENYKYTVLRQKPGATSFVAIATTSATAYTDKDSVENGKTYCYFVRSEGEYSDSTIVRPLINNSQESCATAIDLTPPVTATLTIDANCPTGFLQVRWNDIRPQSDDVDRYVLFYKPTINDAYSEVITLQSTSSLVFNYDGSSSISGCYAVQAIDVNGNKGKLSEDFCIENCPEFELPNVFSPNEDGINDHFKAIKVRHVKEIDLSVTDRWGNLVYTTRDPFFKWDGVSEKTSQAVSEGTFFFVCHVYEQRLKGTIKRTIRGTVHVVR